MKAILFFLSVVTLAATAKPYENYKLLSVVLRSQSDANVVMQVEQLGGDLWSQGLYKNSTATILVSPELLDTVVQLLESNRMVYWVLNDNIQRAIDKEHEDNLMATRDGNIVGTFARYAAIESWLKTKATQCGNNCVLETLGRSYEGRDIHVFRFGKDIKTGATLPRIFSESTLHAREWLAQAAHIYIIDQLLTKFGTDEAITSTLSKVEFDFVVVANPDGYEFTHTNQRLWRKTRSLNPGTVCRGVDGNRNFDFQHCGEGTSNDPCSDIYCGTKPYSEPETEALANYILLYKDLIKGYIATHCYSQFILLPYGYSANTYPEDYPELLEVGNAMASAMLAATNKVYKVGTTPELLFYASSGSSRDWAKAIAGVKHTSTIEMRPPNGTPNGFIVSVTEIEPAGTELLAAFLTLGNKAL